MIAIRGKMGEMWLGEIIAIQRAQSWINSIKLAVNTLTFYSMLGEKQPVEIVAWMEEGNENEDKMCRANNSI